jgi:DNA-binding FadR family transcriptional regulator
MIQFRSVPRLPSYVQVADQIRSAILDRSLSKDEALPPERALAQQFGVSRTTVREALRHLEAQGLLAARGRTSPMHAANPEAAIRRFREALVHVVQLSEVSLADLVELRVAIESAALTRAAASASAEHLAQARASLESMSEKGISAADFQAADVAFHVALVATSGNQALLAVMLAVKDSIALHLKDSLTPRRFAELRPRLLAEHGELLRAVERGNAKAARALLLEHLAFYGT